MLKAPSTKDNKLHLIENLNSRECQVAFLCHYSQVQNSSTHKGLTDELN